MDAESSEIDDLADIELSDFALPGQRPSTTADSQDCSWNSYVIDSIPMEANDDVDYKLSQPDNGMLIGTDLLGLCDVGGEESTIDQAQAQPIESGTAAIDSTYGWNAGNSTNPFLTSTNDLLLPTPSPNNPFRDTSTSVPATNPFESNTPHRHMQPSNPFVEQSPNNPFRSHALPNENKYDDELDVDGSNNVGPTEYVYMSRLPGENIGMVLGIDGDQENRRPIKAVHVKSITPGGAAARACEGSNRILVGDEIREIDGKSLNQLTHDECISLLQEMPDTVVLTIYRQEDYYSVSNKENDLNPGLFSIVDPTTASAEMIDGSDRHAGVSLNSGSEDALEGEDIVIVSDTSLQGKPPLERRSSDISSDPSQIPKGFISVGVTIFKKESDNLGLSIVPSCGSTCDLYQIKRLLPSGACAQVQRLEIGDRLLECNGRSLKGLGQSQCLQVLKSSGPVVDLTVLRPSDKQTTTANAEQKAFLSLTSVGEADDSKDILKFPLQEARSSFSTEDEDSLSFEAGNEVLTPHYNADALFSQNEVPVKETLEDKSNEIGDHNVSDHGKELPSQVEEPIYQRADSLINIPPPVEFSDGKRKENISSSTNEGSPSKCVTNIDDLLFLDVQSNDPVSAPLFSENCPLNSENELLKLDASPSEDLANHSSDDDLINLGSRSIEEFAEKCFESITDQIVAHGVTGHHRNSQKTDNPSQNLSEDEQTGVTTSSSSNLLDPSPDIAGSEKSAYITVVPISSQSQKFVSTIPIQAQYKTTDDTTSSSPSSTEPHPFSSVIQVSTTAPQTKVTKIDVSSSKAVVRPTPAPRTNANYPGSIVFHTYADNDQPILNSTTISLDGEPTSLATMNGHQEIIVSTPGVAVAHTTISISSNAASGVDEELIQSMVMSKDSQGKISYVASTQEKVPSSTQTTKTFNSSRLSDLAESLANHGSEFEGYFRKDVGDDNAATVEEEIVPTVMSGHDKQVAVNVLNQWQNSESSLETSNAFHKTVSTLIQSENQPVSHSSDLLNSSGAIVHTTVGVSANTNIGEEEHIVPMAATKNQQGHMLCAPALPKPAVPEVEKDSSGFLNMANVMLDHHDASHYNSGISKGQTKEDVGDVSEDAIVPTILTKNQTEVLKTAVDYWNRDDTANESKTVETAAVEFLRGANVVPQNSLAHTTVGVSCSARSGEEEELIQPMRVSKDLQGKPLCSPSAPRPHSPVKEKDVSGLLDMASAMLNHQNTDNGFTKQEQIEEAEHVSEEAIVPTVLSKDQAHVVNSVIDGWNSNNKAKPSTIEKAAYGFFRGANVIPNGGTTHTTMGISSTARSGEEEEMIQPMSVAKDLQGKPLWVQPSKSESKPQMEKTLNEAALNDFITALESSSVSVTTNGEVSSEDEISEEVIKPVKMTAGQKQVVSQAIDKWSAIDENPSLLRKAVSRVKASEHQEKVDMTDSKMTLIDTIQNGVVTPNEKSKENAKDIPKEHQNVSTSVLNSVDVINQSKASSGQRNAYHQAASVFEKTQSQPSVVPNEAVVLRSKPRQSTGFKAKLEEFRKQDSSSVSSSSSSSSSLLRSGRPKSMFELPSSKTSLGLRTSGKIADRSSTFKPLTTIKPLGQSIAQKRASVTLTERSGTGLHGSSFLPQTPRADYPKTRQDDGSPFQQDVLAGIVGLGLKVKVTDGYAVITDIQRSGPLGRSGNVKAGDFLLSVNGKELTGQTDARVQQNLRLLPRGLVKLVVSGEKPKDTDSTNLPSEASGDILSSDFDNREAPPLPAATAPVTTASFIATANGIQPVVSHEKSDSQTDLSLSFSSTASELPTNDEQQPPVTARIEISSSNQKGVPMKIAIKPAPAPRHPPGVIARPSTMPRYAYASSTNESWDTSSEDSTPREPGLIVSHKISSGDVIAGQRNPAGGNVNKDSFMTDSSDKTKDSDYDVTVSQSHSSHKDTEMKTPPVDETIAKETVASVNASPKAEPSESSPRKVPPPVAPKPRHSSSSSTKSDNANEKEDQQPGKSTAKISAGYERLQAMAKAKRAKPSKVIENSRAFVSSTAKMYDNKTAEGETSPSSNASVGSSAKVEGSRMNSSLLPMNKRRQSTGSTPSPSKSLSAQHVSSSYTASLSRPKSLISKSGLPTHVSIPEATSPRDDDSPEAKAVKSPTRINSALSPRRASSVDSPTSPVVFKFSQKSAPKVESVNNSESMEGKTLNPALSLHNVRDKFGVHKITSSSLSHEFDSRSSPLTKNEPQSPFNDKPITTALSVRRKSTPSFGSSRSSSITSSVNEEVLEDTMKKFDDLLMDAPYSHTETDPAELLLWAPVRKESSSISNTVQKSRSDLQATTATTKLESDKPAFRPRGKPTDSNINGESNVGNSTEDTESLLITSVSVGNKIEIDVSKSQSDIDIVIPNESEMNGSGEKVIEGDVMTSATHVVSESKPGVSKSQEIEVACEYEDLIKKSACNDDNIPASDMAEHISVAQTEDLQKPIETEHDHTMEIQHDNHSASECRDISDNKEIDVKVEISSTKASEGVQNLEKSLLIKTEDELLSLNIPATSLAADMSHDETVTPNESLITFDSQEIVKNSSSIPVENERLSASTNFVSELDEERNESHLEHARQIVDDVLEKISQDSGSLFNGEIEKSNEEAASLSPSEDEPPPLPGAPPPPIIFRTNTALLTEREWLEDGDDVMTSTKKDVVSSENSSEILLAMEENSEECNASQISNDDKALEENARETFSATNATFQHSTPPVATTAESQIIQLSSENKDDLDLNVVGQNIAMAIKKDHSLDEEEGHSRSDSLEPLNSTGDSCHEAFALRVSSPNSVDVLSEDSGMPADEEFQEVNTDDTVSPSNELRDFVQVDNSKIPDFSDTHKTENLKTSPKPITVHESIAFTKNVNIEVQCAPKEPQSPPPVLPASTPPGLPASTPPDLLISFDPSNNSEVNTPSTPQILSSDSQPLLKEAFSDGKDNVAPPIRLVEEDNKLLNADEKSTSSQEPSVNTPSIESPETTPLENSSPHLEKVIENVQVDEGATVVAEIDTTASNVFSERKWSFFSNKSKSGTVLNGLAGSTTAISFTDKELASCLSGPDLISFMTKANQTLDTLKAPADTDILIVHLHREGDSMPLGIELRPDQEFWFKISTILDNSPCAKQESIKNGDYLMAVDNLWCIQCSLMRCMARITKPKHNSILVVARLNSQLVSKEESSSPRAKSVEKPAHSERPTVAPRSSHPPVPAVKPRQIKSPLSPPPQVSEKQATTSTVETVNQAEPQAKEGSEKPEGVTIQGSGILDVTMMKGATGVGFCLEGGIGSPKGNVPITIKRIFKGGPAEKCGQLKVKDQILAVNGVNFSEMRHYEAWNHLKFLDDGEVHLKINREE